MKRIILIAFILASVPVLSQNVEIMVADTSGNKKNGSFLGQSDESFFLIYEYPKNKRAIKEFSKTDMKYKSQVVFTEPESTYGDLLRQSYEVLKNKIYSIERVYISTNKSYRMYASLLNKDGSFGERVMLAEKPAKKKKDAYNMGHSIEDNYSRLLVYVGDDQTTPGKANFHYVLFDENLKKLGSHNFAFPYADQSTLPGDEEVRGDMLYFFGKDLVNPENKKEKILPKLFAYGFNNDKLNEFSLRGDSVLCYHYSLYISKNDEPVLAGLYSNGTEPDKIVNYLDGGFFVRFSKDLSQIKQQDYRPLEIFSNIDRKRLGPNASYDLSAVNLFDDGGVGIAAEQYKMMVSNTSSRGTEKEISMNDILVFNLGVKPEKRWIVDIKKKQFGTVLSALGNYDMFVYYFSFVFAGDGKSMNFLFNSPPSDMNFTKESGGVQTVKFKDFIDGDKATSYLITVGANGVASGKELPQVFKVQAKETKYNLGVQGVLFGIRKNDENYYGKMFAK